MIRAPAQRHDQPLHHLLISPRLRRIQIRIRKPRHSAYPSRTHNSHLGGHNDRRDVRASAQTTNIADRERTPRQISGREAVVSGSGLQVGGLLRQGADRVGLYVADYGYEETEGGVHCYADVVRAAVEEAGLGCRWRWGGWWFEAGVDEGEIGQGDGDGFEDEGEVGQFRGYCFFIVRGGSGFLAVESGAEGGERSDVDFVGVKEMGDCEGFGHGFVHLCLHGRERDWGFGLRFFLNWGWSWRRGRR